ncbi:serine hydrolase domain-containing protein [Paenibacillus sp. GCM10027626]|uniref:serine hydrolase domain-containing protein n=1 Tax=Paenibacillus sp. GCM10027626 TaxID=3273411 RepID=UPI00363A84D9
MRRKRFSILSLTLVLTMLAPAMATANNNGNKHNFEATKKMASEKASLLTGTYGNASVQYALIDHGDIVISGHSGINGMEENKPLTSDTMYGIGSTSKMVVAAAVMKLVDEGKVDLDLPLTEYIPNFKMKDARYKQITPRMLLNHSSGLDGSTYGNVELFNDNDTYAHDTLLEQLATQSLKADPGAFSVYCNDGFTLAEILVERVSGINFTAFIRKYFTEPLAMTHTKTPLDVDQAKVAGAYSPAYQGQLPTETHNAIGAGGIYSTAEDMVKFSQIFTGQVDSILSSKSIAAMAQEEYKKGIWPEDADASFAYGLGWDSVNLFPFNEYGIQALTKIGDTLLYHSSLVVLPEYNMAAAVLSSGGASTTDQLLANELLLSALQEKGLIQERKPAKSFGVPVKAQMPQEVSRYAGIYGALNSLMKVEINPGGEMSVSAIPASSNPVQKYTYTADGSFVNEDGTAKFKFIVEKNGRTYLWSRVYGTMPGLGQLAFSEYYAEKLEANPLPKDVAAAWKKREGKKYYLVNEKYTSLDYFMSMPILQIHTVNEAPGYMLNNKIKGANKAVNELQIPTLYGRDTKELNFFSKNGVEYIEVAGIIFAGEELVKPLYPGKQSATTIQADGHAKWFSVPAAAKGKVMTVNMPSNGGFAVYDQAGICINNTVVSEKYEFVLPENGRIVFAGEAGSKFAISLK